MPQDIRYSVRSKKPETGRPDDPAVAGLFTVTFDNLTRDETEVLLKAAASFCERFRVLLEKQYNVARLDASAP
jgi:hypothetical protein